MYRESPSITYRFERFTLSPRRRVLLRDGEQVPLIPRYFDLLVLLVERRHEAVHRREIFERVWQDVAVSESALSQAVRTLRRTLGDDSKEPRFIRTVSRHGYQFVLPGVRAEQDEGVPAAAPMPAAVAAYEAPQPTAVRESASFWTAAAEGGALAGAVAGGLGGLMLSLAPDSQAPLVIVPVLAVVGAVCGGLGAASVGLGISAIGTRLTWPAPVAWALGGGLGGAAIGLVVQWLARWAFAALFGLDVAVEGGLQGALLGATVGGTLALAGPQAARRMALVAIGCGLCGLALTLLGHPLVGGTIHMLAGTVAGSPATLTPLARLLGEPDLGATSGAILAVGEAATFGLGMAWGLRRHHNLT